jgi:hypothetical protein
MGEEINRGKPGKRQNRAPVFDPSQPGISDPHDACEQQKPAQGICEIVQIDGHSGD